MPDNGFRKSWRTRLPFGAGGVPGRERFAPRGAGPRVEKREDDGIRWELVARVREKLAMGIYDHPAILERSFDLMVESTEA